MKVLVTGSSGFLGSNFLDFLKSRGVSYLVYDRTNPEKLELEFDSVVNFGGLTPYSNIKNLTVSPEAYLSANPGGTEILLKNISKNKNLKRFINIGTAAEYGCRVLPVNEESEESPDGSYGQSKLRQSKLVEKFSKETGVKVVNLRLFNVAGLPKRTRTGQEIVSNPLLFESLVHQFSTGFNGKITVGNKDDVRDYVDIDDIMEAIFLALETENGEQYEVINICSGIGTKLEDVVNLFGKTLGKECEVCSTQESGATYSIGVNDKARKILNWTPKISLEESIKKITW